MLDIEKLVKQLRGKTDRVRRALIEATMTAALEHAGIDFDITNPFAAKVLAQSGSHVRNIALTTQGEIMRIIKAAHDQGLSIPDTAKTIRASMQHVATNRARTIARTELAAAANGGALGATQIVQSATGDTYYKTWIATNDAHTRPDHADADGQVVPLDAYFQVGGSALQFPGDPAAPADEVVGCRCTLTFTDEAPS